MSYKYDRLSLWLHWLMAALVIAAFALIQYMDMIPKEARGPYRDLHKSIGTLVFVLVLVRLFWASRRPLGFLPAAGSDLMEKMGKMAHLALYFLLFALPLNGILMTFYFGYGIDFGLFKIASPLIADKVIGGSLRNAHTYLGNGIMILAGIHAVAGLFHHFVKKDDVMRRMLP